MLRRVREMHRDAHARGDENIRAHFAVLPSPVPLAGGDEG